jgi:hypothetical protein
MLIILNEGAGNPWKEEGVYIITILTSIGK